MGGWRGEVGLGMSGNGGMGSWVVIYIHGDVFEFVLARKSGAMASCNASRVCGGHCVNIFTRKCVEPCAAKKNVEPRALNVVARCRFGGFKLCNVFVYFGSCCSMVVCTCHALTQS